MYGILANFEPLLPYYCVTILNFKTVFFKEICTEIIFMIYKERVRTKTAVLCGL